MAETLNPTTKNTLKIDDVDNDKVRISMPIPRTAKILPPSLTATAIPNEKSCTNTSTYLSTTITPELVSYSNSIDISNTNTTHSETCSETKMGFVKESKKRNSQQLFIQTKSTNSELLDILVGNDSSNISFPCSPPSRAKNPSPVNQSYRCQHFQLGIELGLLSPSPPPSPPNPLPSLSQFSSSFVGSPSSSSYIFNDIFS